MQYTVRLVVVAFRSSILARLTLIRRTHGSFTVLRVFATYVLGMVGVPYGVHETCSGAYLSFVEGVRSERTYHFFESKLVCVCMCVLCMYVCINPFMKAYPVRKFKEWL